jgi:hypothetical protein
LFYAAIKSKHTAGWFTYCLALAVIFLAPQLLFKYLHFGDPLSPLLERFKTTPDSRVLGFAKFLHHFQDPGFGFPAGIFLPSSFGSVSVTMGCCALLLLLSLIRVKVYPIECCIALVCIVLTIFFGQATARFFVEPYFWLLPVFVWSLPSCKAYLYVARVQVVQLFLLFPFIAYSAYLLVPSLLGNRQRERLLLNSAFGYAETRWMEAVIPTNKVIATSVRSRAFLPRPYFPREYLAIGTSNALKEKKVDSLIRSYNVQYVIAIPGADADRFISRHNGFLIAGPRVFKAATRNPYNSRKYQLAIYKLQ